MYSIGRLRLTAGACLLSVACSGRHAERHAGDPIERRLADESLSAALTCSSTEDIRWAAEGPLTLCSLTDSVLSVVVVRSPENNEIVQFAKRASYAEADSALRSVLARARARLVVELGEPYSECSPASGRRAQWRDGALTVSLVLSSAQGTVDESWTLRESPVVDPCSEQA